MVAGGAHQTSEYDDDHGLACQPYITPYTALAHLLVFYPFLATDSCVRVLLCFAVFCVFHQAGNGGGTHITAIVQALYAFWEERTGEASTE